MKTVLWAALTANGNYARNSSENPPKPEALADFGAQMMRYGNFVVGRETFELNSAGGGQLPPGVDVVVVSSREFEIPGVKRVATPREALDYLAEKGHDVALVAGGATLHNSFLSASLVDELIVNVVPVLEGKGMNLVLPGDTIEDAQLLETNELGGGIVQLHYQLRRSAN